MQTASAALEEAPETSEKQQSEGKIEQDKKSSLCTHEIECSDSSCDSGPNVVKLLLLCYQ